MASEESAADLTSRTLRPAFSSTLSRGSTPAREVVQTTSTRKWLPAAKMTDVNHPELRDYLQKPRLVNTLGCVAPRQPPRPSEFHARRMAANERPVYRNLRLGNFFEQPAGHGEDTIPDMLRQYYQDTFLNGYDTDYLRNYGSDGGDSSGPGSTSSGPVLFHRGM